MMPDPDLLLPFPSLPGASGERDDASPGRDEHRDSTPSMEVAAGILLSPRWDRDRIILALVAWV